MGMRPNNAITTTFNVFDGILRFYHPSLPGSQASFCQDATGQVHVTFTSRPPDCDPVSLLAYGVDLCQNGQIQLPSSSSQGITTSITANSNPVGVSITATNINIFDKHARYLFKYLGNIQSALYFIHHQLKPLKYRYFGFLVQQLKHDYFAINEQPKLVNYR
ncbi:hypothetical protein CaCOL14_011204 [Colletotrichum acutatum]